MYRFIRSPVVHDPRRCSGAEPDQYNAAVFDKNAHGGIRKGPPRGDARNVIILLRQGKREKHDDKNNRGI